MNATDWRQPALDVILASPRSFCAGVVRAIEIVERALARYGPPVYVRHEIVHNQRVIAGLEAKGAVFVGEVDEIPIGAVTIFSAHGVSRQVTADADARSLHVIDATCPLVAKVHGEGQRFAAEDREIVLIGHRNHPEVQGTAGQIEGIVHIVETPEEARRLVPCDPKRLAYITQTTLSLDDAGAIIAVLKLRFPDIVGPRRDDICFASQNRQAAVRALAARVDLVLVIGAANSSNSTRLQELASACGSRSYLLPDAKHLRRDMIDGVSSLGISAGASAPESLVQETIERLSGWRSLTVKTLEGPKEEVRFNLPRALL